jgi:hypothetical protein
MLFDAAGSLIGGGGRNMLVDNAGQSMGGYGSFFDQTNANYANYGIDPNAYIDNGDGTYRVKMSGGNGSANGLTSELIFTAFRHQSDSGAPFIYYLYSINKTSTTTETGTYNITKTY